MWMRLKLGERKLTSKTDKNLSTLRGTRVVKVVLTQRLVWYKCFN